MKYFDITDKEGKVWNCRALPYYKNIISGSIKILSPEHTVLVKSVPKDWTSKILEETFQTIG